MVYLYSSLVCVLCFIVGIYIGKEVFKPSDVVGTLKVMPSDEGDAQPYIFLAIENGGLNKIYSANNGTVIVKVEVKEGF